MDTNLHETNACSTKANYTTKIRKHIQQLPRTTATGTPSSSKGVNIAVPHIPQDNAWHKAKDAENVARKTISREYE